MKISYNWLKEYLDIKDNYELVGEKLTDLGLEVEGIIKYESIPGGLEGVVIGKTKSIRKHPNADRLNITTVDTGDDKDLQIVCGAPNVDKNQTVAVATCGTTLFPNNEKLSNQLLDSGDKVNEKLWRMPLHKNFDKLIDSKNADMQNINYVGGAGSTTAAQFLQRFILNKTPWAHLDIAGMAFSKYGGALNSGGATGFGVRLLNQLIEDDYE